MSPPLSRTLHPTLQVNANTGALSTSVLIDFEVGPRFYQLQVNLVDNGTKLPGPQTTSVTLNITILNVNDPPLLLSPNVTGVPENSPIGSTVYSLVSWDQDGHVVTHSIAGGNVNSGVRVCGVTSLCCNPVTLLWVIVLHC
jgi:hypothetical protein